jgi:adenylate kinase
MKLLLLAPPGAGRGTQGQALADHLGVPHLCSGDLLRAKVRDGSADGREIGAYLARGDLVPDRYLFDVMTPVVVAAAARGGFVLGGFPRTVAQCTTTAELDCRLGLSLDAVFYLYAPEELLQRRLISRGGDTGKDTVAAIRHRLGAFDRYTRPLIAYYRDRGILLAVDATQPPEAVTAEIVSRLQELSLLGGTP